ncbi:MAG: MFS transporter [Spirochaetes bacterium]|nr:MFS transporter [Spirochaetota bacterium]
MSKNIFLLGFVSFFTDVSSEMIYPIIPSFLKSLLHQSAGKFLGIIEGIAEATASLGKVYFGYISDKLKKRKLFAILGYAFSAFSKIVLLFSTFWTHVLGGRFLDRVGKSVRTAPRDAILSESVDKKNRGMGFGIQRAMDFAGAFMGTLISMYIIHLLRNTENKIEVFYLIFFYALIPAFIGVFILFLVREPKSLKNDNAVKKPELSFKKLDKRLKIFIGATFLFALGNSSNQFLILRSRDIGFSLMWSLILYLSYNLTSTIFLPVFGKISDKIGRKKVMLTGYFLYALVYLGFGLFRIKGAFFVLWILYGLYSALTEGVEKAYVSDLSKAENRGTALGLFATAIGVGLLPASIIAGFLYTINPSYPFILGSILSLSASIFIWKGK